MAADPILDELHRVRADMAERFGGDLRKLVQHLSEEERRSGHPLVSRPPRKPGPSEPVRRPDSKSDAA